MTWTPTIKSQYDSIKEPLDTMGRNVADWLTQMCDENGVLFQAVQYRVKELDSLRDKLSDQGSERPLEEIHDVLGLRVITFFPDAVDDVKRIVEKKFRVDQRNSIDKRELLKPDRFGYLSLHYVVRLKAGEARVLAAKAVAGHKFEIQIRSLLQHAWAEIEHDLGYKSAISVPYELRRRFTRLAGLLEVGDDEFRRLRDDAAEKRASLSEAVRVGTAPIDKDSLVVLIAEDEEIRLFDDELWLMFGRTGLDFKPRYQASNLSTELQALGITTVGQARSDWRDHRDVIVRFLDEWQRRDVLFASEAPRISLFCLVFLRIAATGGAREIEALFHKLSISEFAHRQHLAEVVDAVYRAVNGDAETDEPGRVRRRHL